MRAPLGSLNTTLMASGASAGGSEGTCSAKLILS